MNVTLRKKSISDEKFSYYLDYYGKGIRKFEHLKLHGYKNPIDKVQKKQNKEIEILAKSIQSKRLIEIKNNEFGFNFTKNENINFFELIVLVSNRSELRPNSKKSYISLKNSLSKFHKSKNLSLYDINEVFVRKFLNYLNMSCVERTVNHRLTILRAVLNYARENNYINENPIKNIKYLKEKHLDREYLTIDEIQRLVNTRCNNYSLKKAFIFCCYTGLRKSDVFNLKWGNIKSVKNNSYILLEMVKTRNEVVIPLKSQMIELIGDRKGDDQLVFNGLCYNQAFQMNIKKWVYKAGIHKHITFHSSRHSFATNLAIQGIPIEVTSKLLGHKKLSTTQIYYQVVNSLKVNAVEQLPELENISMLS